MLMSQITIVNKFKELFMAENKINLEMEIKNTQLTQECLRILLKWAYEKYHKQKTKHINETKILQTQIDNLLNQSENLNKDKTILFYKDQIEKLSQKWCNSVEECVKQKKIINGLNIDNRSLSSALNENVQKYEKIQQDQQNGMIKRELLKKELEKQAYDDLSKFNYFKEEIMQIINMVLWEAEEFQILNNKNNGEIDIICQLKYENTLKQIQEIEYLLSKFIMSIENYLIKFRDNIIQDDYNQQLVEQLKKCQDCLTQLKMLLKLIRSRLLELTNLTVQLQGVIQKQKDDQIKDKSRLIQEQKQLQQLIIQLIDQIMIERKISIQFVEELGCQNIQQSNLNINEKSSQEEDPIYKNYITKILFYLNNLINKKFQAMIKGKYNDSEEIDVITKIKSFINLQQKSKSNTNLDEMSLEEKKCNDIFKIFYSSLGQINYKQNIFQIIYQVQIIMKQTLKLKGLLQNDILSETIR